jgi:hypothetical protein
MPYLKKRSRWWIKMLVWLPASLRNFMYDCILPADTDALEKFRVRAWSKIFKSEKDG